jgi:hypothetical protein
VTEQHQIDRVEDLERKAVSMLKEEVELSLKKIVEDLENRFRIMRLYALVCIKLALHMYSRSKFSASDPRLRFHGHATEVFVTRVYDMLPADALKNLHKYDPEVYRKFIEGLYVNVDVTPFLEPPADYRQE